MKVITFGWREFSLKGMSRQQTRHWLEWGAAQYGIVSGLRFEWFKDGDKPDIVISGGTFTDFAGLAWKDRIEISTRVDLSARNGFLAGQIFAHEFGHTYARFNLPKWSHASDIDALMYWRGASDDWFSPSEVIWLQRVAGKPKQRFWPHEITYVGNQLRAMRKQIADLIAVRDNSTDKAIRSKAHAEQLELRRVRRQLHRRWVAKSSIWKSVPMANTPNVNTMSLLEARRILQVTRPYPLPPSTLCGCGRRNIGENIDPAPIDSSDIEN